MLDSLTQLTRQPEYLHTLLNPLPIYGLAVGLLGLVIAVFLRSRPAQIATLAIVLISASAAFPVYVLGEAAEDRMEGIVDDAGRDWLEEHEHRAERVIYVFYLVAALAAAALFVPLRWAKFGTPLSLVVILAGCVALAAGGYIAKAGGQIRHREFRTGGPPPGSGDAEARDHETGAEESADDSGRGRGRGRGRGGDR
jgi:hypothetical protein